MAALTKSLLSRICCATLLSPLACTSTPDAAEETGTDADTGAQESSLFRAFEAEGFITQRGHASSFLIEDCADLDDCFGNNPTSPYVLFNLPAYPDRPETLPPSLNGDVPKVPEGMQPAYRLEANEAIVIVGTLPPPAKYVGFTPYLYSREGASGPVTVFASLGDTLNHVNLATAEADGASEMAIIASSDRSAADAARAALVADGFQDAAINEMVFPRDVVRFGVESDADALFILGRVALFEDAGAGDAYMEDIPLEVFRLTPSTTGDPIAAPLRTPRGDGTNEDAFEDALDELEAAIELSLVGSSFEQVPIAGSGAVSLVIDPEQCIEAVTECLGDNGDTTYSAGPLSAFVGETPLLLGPDEAFVVYGVNHAATGKAEYSAAAVYAQAKRAGVLTLNDGEMVGTADRYLPGHPDADKLFAFEVRRDCAGREDCLTLPTTFPGIGLDENLFFIFRAYINPGLTVSPDHDELLTERVIKVLAP